MGQSHKVQGSSGGGPPVVGEWGRFAGLMSWESTSDILHRLQNLQTIYCTVRCIYINMRYREINCDLSSSAAIRKESFRIPGPVDMREPQNLTPPEARVKRAP